MSVVFRTDASLEIGIGHVMRCLTLAEALRAKGESCRFVCRVHSGDLLELIRQRGFEAHVLPAEHGSNKAGLEEGIEIKELAHAAWLGADWRTDAGQTKVCLSEASVDWLIVDHYGIDARWEKQLRSACRHLMVIDDLADRRHDCDLLLDQNLGRDARDYIELVPANCKILIGPKYALLRPEFAELRDYSLARRATSQLKQLLITMGGVDKDNATGRVLDALRESRLPENCHITVVMGSTAPWLAQVHDKALHLPWNTEVLVNVQNIATLMAESDLAIGAAGSTSWERCSLGLPSIIVVLADNQKLIAHGLELANAVNIVHLETLQVDINNALEEILSSSDTLERISLNAAALTDGMGTNNVVTKLYEKEVA